MNFKILTLLALTVLAVSCNSQKSGGSSSTSPMDANPAAAFPLTTSTACSPACGSGQVCASPVFCTSAPKCDCSLAASPSCVTGTAVASVGQACSNGTTPCGVGLVCTSGGTCGYRTTTSACYAQ